jgi:hypothetical protein
MSPCPPAHQGQHSAAHHTQRTIHRQVIPAAPNSLVIHAAAVYGCCLSTALEGIWPNMAAVLHAAPDTKARRWATLLVQMLLLLSALVMLPMMMI